MNASILQATILHAAVLFALFPLAQAAADDPTLPPAAAQLRFTARGRGVQIYQCVAQGDAYAWVLQAPEAILLDPKTGAQLGTHSAGPTWTWTDGSSITGKILQKQPAPDPASIPWLLLEAHAANQTIGALTDIAFVRRSDTAAGAAPSTGCDAKAAAESTTLRVPYAATYTFYTAAQ